QFNIANFLAGQIQYFCCWHNGTSVRTIRDCLTPYCLLWRAAFLTTTTLPFAPGTAPLIINKLFSASTRATVSRFIVTRTSPMWPDERLPLITRDGNADAPIEPGARTFI